MHTQINNVLAPRSGAAAGVGARVGGEVREREVMDKPGEGEEGEGERERERERWRGCRGKGDRDVDKKKKQEKRKGENARERNIERGEEG